MPKIKYKLPKIGQRVNMGAGIVDKVVNDREVIITLDEVKADADGYFYNQVRMKPVVVWRFKGRI